MPERTQPRETGFLYSLAANGQFDRLIGYLASNEPPELRRAAATHLRKHSDALTPAHQTALTQAALTETDDTVRARVVETLQAVDETGIETLTAKIAADSEPTPTASPHPLLFVEWLDSEHAALRVLAVAGLSEVATDELLPELIRATEDPNPHVKRRAVRACGRVGDDRAVSAVADCLDSDHVPVQIAAASALVEIGTETATETLLAAARSDDDSLREIVLSELGELGKLEAVGVLLHGLTAEKEAIQQAATRSLVALIAAAPASESHIVRESVASQLEYWPTEELQPRFCSLATDSDQPAIRRNAVWLLGRIAGSDPPTAVVGCLITAIADDDDRTATLATSKLAQIDDPEIIERVEQFIKTNELDSATLKRADFLREQITDPSVKTQRQNAVTYTTVSDPADYTKQHSSDSR